MYHVSAQGVDEHIIIINKKKNQLFQIQILQTIFIICLGCRIICRVVELYSISNNIDY